MGIYFLGVPINKAFFHFSGNNWRVISGKIEGQTQVASSQFDDLCRWSFPIDIHLATAGIQGNSCIYYLGYI